MQVLGGIADTVAQSITVIRSRTKANQRLSDPSVFISLDLDDVKKEKPSAMGEIGYHKKAPSFDFERLTRFMAYGFFMAPIQFQWFGFLSRAFPITKSHATAPAMKRVAMDQLIFAPIGMANPLQPPF